MQNKANLESPPTGGASGWYEQTQLDGVRTGDSERLSSAADDLERAFEPNVLGRVTYHDLERPRLDNPFQMAIQ